MKVFIYLWIIAASMIIFSCRTKEGAPGPAGEDALTKQGSISGTLKTVNSKNDSISIPFEFNYFESLEENTFEDYKGTLYTSSFKRRSLKEKGSYFVMSNNSPVTKGETPTNLTVDFGLLLVQSNGSYFIFEDMDCPDGCNETVNLVPYNDKTLPAAITYSNYSFDFETGKLSFNYRIFYPAANNNLNRDAIVTGSVNVVLNKFARP